MGDSEVDKTKKYYVMLIIGINDHFWDEVLEIEIPKRTTGLDVYRAYRETLLPPPPRLSLPLSLWKESTVGITSPLKD